ncbi:probable inactive receptor kinase At1g48480 [Humulus lupulus]|uniref:probable inactive receptor kinase At1g48480 n=1 Tax=Humulus lupulus TaxID=3486 RepID=UPI002B40C78C|nr:probable inactive receptor kinase At1g48480 [Humulus lupulus]
MTVPSIFSIKSSMSLPVLITSFLLLLIFTIAKQEDQQDNYYYYYSERTALYSLKAVLNHHFLNKVWSGPHCNLSTPIWYGIKCSNEGHVAELVLENMNLSGRISLNAFVKLTDLSTLSFKNNSLSGTLMEFGLNPKLTRIDLSRNLFTGEIPISVLGLLGLVSFLVEENSLTGPVPAFNQTSLREFNVSYNNLSGVVPLTPSLELFGSDSYAGNNELDYSSVVSHAQNATTPSSTTEDYSSSSNDNKKKSYTKYLLLLNVVLVAVVVLMVVLYLRKRKKLKKIIKDRTKQGGESKEGANNNDQRIVIKSEGNENINHQIIKTVEVKKASASTSTGADIEKRLTKTNQKKSIGGEGSEGSEGKLMFLGGDDEVEERSFAIGDLLKASAEGLGHGTFGNCYKAMIMEEKVVVVKRLKNLKPLADEEFNKKLLLVASLKHPNLLPVMAYYNSKNEKLLLYKYVERGNLYQRIHGAKGERGRIPFRWGSRLNVARGVARAIEYLHLNTSSQVTVPHGNLKSTNILLGWNDTALVSDYGLAFLIIAPAVVIQRTVSYRSPEYKSTRRVSKKTDVWSYGCLLLELLTGKVAAYTAPAGVKGVDLCSWVYKAVREEWTAEIFDGEIAVNRRSAVPGMLRMLEIALNCIEKSPEKRPHMSEVVRELEEIQFVDQSEDDDGPYTSMERSYTTDDSISITV